LVNPVPARVVRPPSRTTKKDCERSVCSKEQKVKVAAEAKGDECRMKWARREDL
jgi:hypothetical protein